jgi:hypothetical protein
MKKSTCFIFIIITLLFFQACQKNNFSGAAFDGFLILNDNINKNSKIVKRYSESIIDELETKQYHLFLAVAAKEAMKISEEYYDYIDNLRAQLILESGGVYSKEEAVKTGCPQCEGQPKGIADKDTPHKIFFSGYYKNKKIIAQGPVLEKKLMELKAAYLNHIGNLWVNESSSYSIFKDSSKKERKLKELEAELTLGSSENYNPENHDGKTWAEYTFGNLSVAAVLPLLSKFQNDIRTSENALVSFLSEQIGGSWSYKIFPTMAIPPLGFVHSGETYKAEIVLGGISSHKILNVTADTDTLPLLLDNRVLYRSIPDSKGKKKIDVEITVFDPINGKTDKVNGELNFEVR